MSDQLTPRQREIVDIRNLSTDYGRRLWESVERVASQCPDWITIPTTQDHLPLKGSSPDTEKNDDL